QSLHLVHHEAGDTWLDDCFLVKKRGAWLELDDCRPWRSERESEMPESGRRDQRDVSIRARLACQASRACSLFRMPELGLHHGFEGEPQSAKERLTRLLCGILGLPGQLQRVRQIADEPLGLAHEGKNPRPSVLVARVLRTIREVP